jgi:SAM-dependent methyltransferase
VIDLGWAIRFVTAMGGELTLADGRRLFGADPAGYASGRPGYPQEVYEILVGRCGLRAGTATLEIGPGGGQATERLLELGARPLVAIEPDPSLAGYLRARFGDDVDVRITPFEDVEVPVATFDLAASATAFHWVDRRRGIAQLARSLRPGGWWAGWWTIFHDPEREDLLYEALSPILSTLPRVSGGRGHNGAATTFALDRHQRFSDLEVAGLFTSVEAEHLRWSLELDPAAARGLYATFSPVIALPDGRREEVLQEIERVIQERFDGRVVRSAVTVVYTARRTAVPTS